VIGLEMEGSYYQNHSICLKKSEKCSKNVKVDMPIMPLIIHLKQEASASGGLGTTGKTHLFDYH
jgi:hypothetical protein